MIMEGIPAGRYQGRWSGSDVFFRIPSGDRIAKSDSILPQHSPCVVTIGPGWNWSVEVATEEEIDREFLKPICDALDAEDRTVSANNALDFLKAHFDAYFGKTKWECLGIDFIVKECEFPDILFNLETRAFGRMCITRTFSEGKTRWTAVHASGESNCIIEARLNYHQIRKDLGLVAVASHG